MENAARMLGLHTNQEKTKCMIVKRKNTLKQNQIGYLKIKNYKLKRAENFKHPGVIPYFMKITITKYTYKKE
jgi:hypothetical protein